MKLFYDLIHKDKSGTKIKDFHSVPRAIFQTGMICGSFKIQYQRIGVDSFHSLDKIELKQSMGLFLWQYDTF